MGYPIRKSFWLTASWHLSSGYVLAAILRLAFRQVGGEACFVFTFPGLELVAVRSAASGTAGAIPLLRVLVGGCTDSPGVGFKRPVGVPVAAAGPEIW